MSDFLLSVSGKNSRDEGAKFIDLPIAMRRTLFPFAEIAPYMAMLPAAARVAFDASISLERRVEPGKCSPASRKSYSVQFVVTSASLAPARAAPLTGPWYGVSALLSHVALASAVCQCELSSVTHSCRLP